MKKLNLIICAFFVLCGGFLFASCGDKAKLDFDVNKITIDKKAIYEYDGSAHAFDVKYEDVDLNVKYALESNKNDFKPLSKLATINADTYRLYYKISAKGYNSYVSTEPIELEVVPRTLEVFIDNYVWFKSDKEFTFNGTYMSIGHVMGDDLGLTFVCPDLDVDNAEYDREYDLTCTINNPNYELEVVPGKMIVQDYFPIYTSNGSPKTYCSDFFEAIELADDGDCIVLNKSIEINKTIVVDKSITFDGQRRFSIFAQRTFQKALLQDKEVATMFMVNNKDVTLTLKDIKLNNNKTVRGVSAFAGKVVIDGATISNGKKTDKWRSGGVYITANASFEMKSGTITGNSANDNEYTKYCSDLWIGANANGTMASISGGTVGNVFVNSNSFSATGAGKFVLDGGKVTNVYVEYDSGYGAQFEYIKGDIEHLKIALKNENCLYYGAYHELSPVENTTYVGGKLIYETTENAYDGVTYDENLDWLIDGETYIFDNCNFNVAISTTKNVGLIFNNCTFATNETATNLYLTSVTNLVVNNCIFTGNTTGGYAIDVNLYSVTCEEFVIANNIFNTTTDDKSAISIKARLGSTDYATADWADNQTEGKFDCQVQILGNDFNSSNNSISIGAEPQGLSTAANVSTGDFDLLVNKNLDLLTVYNKFKDSVYAQGEFVSKVIVAEQGLYDTLNN